MTCTHPRAVRRVRRTAPRTAPIASLVNENDDFRARQEITNEIVRALPGLHDFARQGRKAGSLTTRGPAN